MNCSVPWSSVTHVQDIFRPSWPLAFETRLFVKQEGFLDADLWIISEVTLLKIADGAEHEYICVELHHRHSEEVSYIITERMACNIKYVLATSSCSGSFLSSYASSPALSNMRRNNLRAFDRVIVTRSLEELEDGDTGLSGDIVRRISFDPCHHHPTTHAIPIVPSALDLGLLLKIIHQHRPQYELFSTQCYWYTYTVCEALIQLFPRAHKLGHADHNAGLFRGVGFPKTDSVDAVVDEFRQQITSFRNHWAECKRKCRTAHPLEVYTELELVKTQLAQAQARLAEADLRA